MQDSLLLTLANVIHRLTSDVSNFRYFFEKLRIRSSADNFFKLPDSTQRFLHVS